VPGFSDDAGLLDDGGLTTTGSDAGNGFGGGGSGNSGGGCAVVATGSGEVPNFVLFGAAFGVVAIGARRRRKSL
jgi:MYXO-CTERM domain-containing protein